MEQIFIKLLNISISAGWMVLALLLLRPLLKKAPKWISCLLWGFVGLRLCLPVSIESMLSLIPSAQTVPEGIMLDTSPAIDSGISSINSAVNPVIGQVFAPDPATSANPLQIGMFLAAAVWIVGMVVMALYAAISYGLLRRKLREAVRQQENIWVCDRVDSPFLLGLIRPRIYLPSDLSAESAAYVIAHEQAHLKRRDHLWKPLGFLLLTVYWFNPLLWVAYILLCRDIEYACDEKVLQSMGADHKSAYSEALIRCSSPRKLISACPVAFGEDGVKGRVKSVLNYKKPAFWIMIAAVAVSVAVAVCFLTDPAAPTQLTGGIFETDQCRYSHVISADKETKTNELSFHIDGGGQVYKDYGDGNQELLGALQPSDYTPDDLNAAFNRVGAACRYTRRATDGWELLDGDGKRSYVFFPGTGGSADLISFFSDGSVMNWFTLDRTGDFVSAAKPYSWAFRAMVVEIGDNYLLVEPMPGEREGNTSDRFRISASEDLLDQVRYGDIVRITYDGMIQELYPSVLPNIFEIVIDNSGVESVQDRLQKRYPQFYGLSTDKGLEVYVWYDGQYRCGLRGSTSEKPTTEELHTLGEGASLAEMALILQNYGVSREDVVILYTYHPAFSGQYPDVPKDQAFIEECLLSGLTGEPPTAEWESVLRGADIGFDPNRTYPLVIYATMYGPEAWQFHFIKNTSICHTAVDFIGMAGMNLAHARQALAAYDLDPEDIPVVVYSSVLSSYVFIINDNTVQTARKCLFSTELE